MTDPHSPDRLADTADQQARDALDAMDRAAKETRNDQPRR